MIKVLVLRHKRENQSDTSLAWFMLQNIYSHALRYKEQRGKEC